MSDTGFGELERQLRGVAAQLARSGEAMQEAMAQAQARTYEATAPDGSAAVRVDGRSRILDLALDTRPTGRDAKTLENSLVTLLNQALTQARTQTSSAVLDTLPEALRRTVDQATEEPRR